MVGVMVSVKVDKEKLNLLLKFIHEDNITYGLILKLVYIYGRNIGEVLNLQVKDIDLKHNTIDFKLPTEEVSFMIHNEIKDELVNIISNFTSDEYIFLGDFNGVNNTKKINTFSNKINRYLHDFISKVNRDYGLNYSYPNLICTDFKRLRGQHLFMDGVELSIINNLYKIHNNQTLKKLINFEELNNLKYPCRNIDILFHKYTDLNLFKENNIDLSNRLFMIITSEGEVFIEFNAVTGEFNVFDYDNESSLNLLEDFSFKDLKEDLLNFDVGNYKFFKGFKIIRI